jgi:hypothetical protein
MCSLPLLSLAQEKRASSADVPILLDHNRMLVEAEFQREDGSWRRARLWVDTGNPELFLSENLARDLGLDLTGAKPGAGGGLEPLAVPASAAARIGGMALDFKGVKAKVMFEPRWLFTTMHIDANLPATVLKQFDVVFDYPARRLTLALPGTLTPRGTRVAAGVKEKTGIVQIDASIDGEQLSFALDNGASYSFASAELLARVAKRHPGWPSATGALGCANIWGWWPEEPSWPILRLAEMKWGTVSLTDVGLVGLPKFFPGGASLGAWYSLKTARPVEGILGPNAFKNFRIQIDYAGGAVYFEKGGPPEVHDMDIVGLTLRPAEDGSYQVIGVAKKGGRTAVVGVEPGDTLLQVGELKVMGATMGSIIDALRGNPGDIRTLVLERGAKRMRVQARVERFL